MIGLFEAIEEEKSSIDIDIDSNGFIQDEVSVEGIKNLDSFIVVIDPSEKQQIYRMKSNNSKK